MFLNGQDPARPEGGERGAEHPVQHAAPHEIVDVASGQDEVDRSRRGQRSGRRSEADGLDLAPYRRVAEAGLEARHALALSRRGLRIVEVGDGADVAAAGGLGEGREHLGPVAAARVDLEDHVGRL